MKITIWSNRINYFYNKSIKLRRITENIKKPVMKNSLNWNKYDNNAKFIRKEEMK